MALFLQSENLTSRKKQKKQKNFSNAELLGVHLEGPFLSAKKSGAQNKEYLIPPDIELFEKWQQLSGNNIRLITIAPELPGAIEFIRHCVKKNIIMSIGHTDADYEKTKEAIAAGAMHATHLFNAMPPIH